MLVYPGGKHIFVSSIARQDQSRQWNPIPKAKTPEAFFRVGWWVLAGWLKTHGQTKKQLQMGWKAVISGVINGNWGEKSPNL